MTAHPPSDPRVRHFLDLLADAVVNDLRREITTEQLAHNPLGHVARTPESAHANESAGDRA